MGIKINKLKKYWFPILLIIISIITTIVFYPLAQLDSNKVKVSSLSSFNVKQLLANDNNNIYYYNGSQIIKMNTNETSSAQVIDNDVVFVNTSTSGKKIYYIKGIGKNAKSFIFNLDQNTKKEYKQYDGFFWFNNDGKFIEFTKNASNILNESLKREYQNLVYSNFDSFSGIILGSTVKTTPELEGYRWDVVNKSSTNMKSLEILNSGSKPWTVGSYMVYLADNNKFNTINQQGKKIESKESIDSNQLTRMDSEQQKFTKFDKNNIIVGDINLKDGSIYNKKVYKIENLVKKNAINTTKQTSQTYLYNNLLYMIVYNKVLEAEL
jgi:hypothetical protein